MVDSFPNYLKRHDSRNLDEIIDNYGLVLIDNCALSSTNEHNYHSKIKYKDSITRSLLKFRRHLKVLKKYLEKDNVKVIGSVLEEHIDLQKIFYKIIDELNLKKINTKPIDKRSSSYKYKFSKYKSYISLLRDYNKTLKLFEDNLEIMGQYRGEIINLDPVNLESQTDRNLVGASIDYLIRNNDQKAAILTRDTDIIKIASFVRRQVDSLPLDVLFASQEDVEEIKIISF